MTDGRRPEMVWTVVGVAGIASLVAAAFLVGGPAAALAMLGAWLLLAAVDGRRG